MKSIAWVNVKTPSAENYIAYNSDYSLRDFDIIVFSADLPYYNRIDFDGGGSCITIEDTKKFIKASSHWHSELKSALLNGKTVFVVLQMLEEDRGAASFTYTSKNNRSYKTVGLRSYSAIPAELAVKNSRGRRILVKDPAFRGIYDAIKEISEYRIVFEDISNLKTVYTARDGAAVGGVIKSTDWSGSLVLLPNFEFTGEDIVGTTDGFDEYWTEKAIIIHRNLVSQIVAVDKVLKGAAGLTPPPDWVADIRRPKILDDIDMRTSEIDAQIDDLLRQREELILSRSELLEYSHLLYETGKPLERAIEKTLQILGYRVETLRIGDLEIDHILIGPSGRRMIGESEGKDSSAIEISKFRQLETNINEDFERDEVQEHAKGILFGNGFRLTNPTERDEQFTQKSLANAKRLGSALVRTADLYAVAIHLLNHPEDEKFAAACRDAIENTLGGIVQFPSANAG